MTRTLTVGLLACLSLFGCRKSPSSSSTGLTVGLVTDVGGRGDHSFNDSALRGLETWAAGVTFRSGAYHQLPDAERQGTIPPDLKGRVTVLDVKPVVVQSRAQEDYTPNLQLLVDQGARLTIGVGFMLENAVEAVAKANPSAKFLLIDSPILDAKGTAYTLPGVRTVCFREEEGSFLVGALAGLLALDLQQGRGGSVESTLGFVGGMEIPLIKKFEAGYRAGVKATNPKAAVLVQYTGSFDNVSAGKLVAQDLVAKGAMVVFQAAGSDGLGVIQALKEARAAGKDVYVIGVDSDQSHLAPDTVLTSMTKQVDLAVWQAAKDLSTKTFAGGDLVMGLKEGGVSFAPVRLGWPGKQKALERVEALRQQIVAGTLRVPTKPEELGQ